MRKDKVLAGLQSAVAEERIRATYELGNGDFSDPNILGVVRANLRSTDPDLIEITIMRLMLRGKDTQSLQEVLAILKSTRDDLVFSAALMALTSLARDFPETAALTRRELEDLPTRNLSGDDRARLNDAKTELGQLGA